MTSNSKSIQVSIRIPRNTHQNFNLLKDKGLIQLSLTEALLRGVELTITEALEKHYTPVLSITREEANELIEKANKEEENDDK
ncbi:hypothetical protein ACHHV8_11020 [Paenibacillus sp. TAB 01]|uniref:hypothetical protein n=1 Tax=Paenibacillus sp. TAB 01 TaxID=3368988 RepID=UPI00375390D4